MSYMMDFEDASNIGEHDEVYDYDGFQVVCDRKKPAISIRPHAGLQ